MLRFPNFIKEWEWKEAEQIFQSITDKNHPEDTVLTIQQGKGTLPRELSGRNILYDNTNIKNYKRVHFGDFIIHLRSFEGGLEMANEQGIVSPAYTILRNKKNIEFGFYKAYFRTNEFINHVLLKSVEGIRDGKQISYDAFKWLSIPYCQVEEQQKIADFLSLVDLRIEKQRQLVESLKKYKRGLFQELFVDFDRIPSSGHNHMIFIGKYSPVSTKKGVYTMKITANTQFKTLINTWLIQKRPMVTPSTHANFVLIVENHLIPYFGRKKISAITEADIQTYINTLYNEGRLDKTGGLTVKTIRDIILVLRLCLIFAYKEHVISMLNWDLIEYPKDFAVKNIISLSKDEELALIQCIYMKMNRRTAGVLIALFTGIRIGELCGLKMQDISIIDKTITIQRTVQRIYNKTTRTSYVYVGAPKTASSARTIPLPSLLVNIIKKYYTDNPNQYFLTGKTKPTEPRTYRQFFVRFLKKHKLRSVKFHEIRHTFAVRAIEIPEFDIKSLSEILGHKNVSFTLNVYGRANMQQKIKCMNLLNELL